MCKHIPFISGILKLVSDFFYRDLCSHPIELFQITGARLIVFSSFKLLLNCSTKCKVPKIVCTI
jgi:hypothetical protein